MCLSDVSWSPSPVPAVCEHSVSRFVLLSVHVTATVRLPHTCTILEFLALCHHISTSLIRLRALLCFGCSSPPTCWTIPPEHWQPGVQLRLSSMVRSEHDTAPTTHCFHCWPGGQALPSPDTASESRSIQNPLGLIKNKNNASLSLFYYFPAKTYRSLIYFSLQLQGSKQNMQYNPLGVSNPSRNAAQHSFRISLNLLFPLCFSDRFDS